MHEFNKHLPQHWPKGIWLLLAIYLHSMESNCIRDMMMILVLVSNLLVTINELDIISAKLV